MAYFYMDTDGGSDASNGTTWALAKLTFEGLLSVMSAGDIGVVQGAANDTTAAARTFTSPGTAINPCIILGVVDGTTNTGTSIVASDLAVTLPRISNTGANNVTFAGSISLNNIHLTVGQHTYVGQDTTVQIVNGKYSPGVLVIGAQESEINLINTEYEAVGTSSELLLATQCYFSMRGGTWTFTSAANLFSATATGIVDIRGVDLSGLTVPVHGGSGTGARIRLINCRVPASLTLYGSTPTHPTQSIEVISSSNTTSQAVGSSIQDYQYEDAFGTVDLEATIVRTGGADDSATGVFAYAMTPHVNATLEHSTATLKSPWMAVWLAGGANTVTVYIANDTASTDFNEDEVWVEFYTPDAGDTAQHDQTFDPANARLLDSTTIITDDTGSTWGSGGNNHQKLSVAVTTGFEGTAYARLHFAKRYAASPATLYLDPKLAVT